MAFQPAPPQPPSLRWFGPGVAGLFSLLAVASLPMLPLVGAFIALLAPLPLVHVVATGRPSFMAWGWVAVGLMAAVFLFESPWLVAACVAYLLIAVWPAVAVEIWVRREWTTGRFMAIVTLLALVMVAGVLAAVFYPVFPADGLGVLLERATAGATEMARALGSSGAGVQDMLTWAVHATAYLAPALGALYVLSGALWLRPRLPLLGLPRGAEPFALYSSEEWLPLGFALGGLGWVFLSEPGKWLATNLFVTVLGLYFVHGLAIILFYLGRRFGGNRWVRFGVALFALQMPVALVFSVLGLVDSFFRLRRGGALDGGHNA